MKTSVKDQEYNPRVISQIKWLPICFILIFQFSNGQNFIPVDTLNVEYRQNLKNLYAKRVSIQEGIFKQNLTDPSIRKEVESIYKEVSTGFMEGIDKGYFLDDRMYREQFDAILNNLKTSNPELSNIENTKILLSPGTSPNAYAVGNDIVVVYIPLLKKIRNQYQLAFIISHEIAHNILNHSYNGIIKKASLKNSKALIQKTKELKKKKYNRGSEAITLYRDLVYGSTQNSRKLEQQADSLGFIIFKNAYAGKEYEAVKSLENLENIDKETDSLVTQDYINLFETEQLLFRESWIDNAELESYKYDSSIKFWAIDSLRTHPDSGIRAASIKNNFHIKESEFHKDSDSFNEMKFASWNNDALGLYVIKEYGKSLYETLLLLKKDPENSFLRNLVYQNLTKIQAAQKSYTLDRYVDRPHPKNSDSYNSFLNFLRELRRKEMNIIINNYKS